MRWLTVAMVGAIAACGSSDDAHRCGSPPVDCLGGTCSDGVCTAWRVATSADFPLALAVDGDDLDWTTQSGDLFSAPKAGGDATQLAHVADGGATWAIAPSPKSLYVATFADGLVAVDRSSLALSTIDTGNVPAVATDILGDVYWAATTWGSPSTVAGIKRMQEGTSVTDTLAPGEESDVVAIDDAGVYWIDGVSNGWWWGCTLWNDPCKNAQLPVRARFADGAFTTYAAATPSPGSLAADGEALYVGDWCAGTVTRIDHATGTATVIASDLAWPGAVLVDDTSVYVVLVSRCNVGWTGSTGGGEIIRVAKRGGPFTVLRTLGSNPSAAAMDDTTLYYVSRDDTPGASATHQSLFAIAKPAP